MIIRTTSLYLILAALVAEAAQCQPALMAQNTNLLEIVSVEVNGKTFKHVPGHELNIGPSPQHIVFNYGAVSNATRKPLRVQSKLEGVDRNWRDGGGDMNVVVRYYDAAGGIVSYHPFKVLGDSAGWNGNLTTSILTHRRETLIVPPGASRMWVILSSAGPPSATGIYIIDNLVVSRVSPNSEKLETLLRSPFSREDVESQANDQNLTGWERDGDRPTMAKIVEIGQEPKTKAIAILDDDPNGHAEWHNDMTIAPQISPNDKIVIEWNEMFSIGESENRQVIYDTLAPGTYTFHVGEATLFGKRTGIETTAIIRVPVAVWEKPWFWALLGAAIVGISAAVLRYISKQKLQRTMAKLQQQRALEQERLRIARDIHDDLGARITQISLLSGMAESDASFPEIARTKFDQISTMSRDLVSALYDTVWAVNPENDNLDAMVNHLCERINELCDHAQLKCRLHVSELPKTAEVSSRARHNISMVVKEAMHNIIKHAGASQVAVYIKFAENVLTIEIHDNGAGFDHATVQHGNGLGNMEDRMKEIGGMISIQSGEKGTVVSLQLNMTALQKTPQANSFSQTSDMLEELE